MRNGMVNETLKSILGLIWTHCTYIPSTLTGCHGPPVLPSATAQRCPLCRTIIHTCHSAPQQSSPQPTPAVPDSVTHSLPHPSLLCKTVQYFPNPDWFSSMTNSACPGISSCFSEFSNHFYCQLSFLPGSPCWYLSYISNCIKSCSSADCFRT